MVKELNRRKFIKLIGVGAAAMTIPNRNYIFAQDAKESSTNNIPNVILCMADDLGWGDTGYNDHPKLKTPNLDDMSKSGIRFNRWYSGAPVCSPTRGSCITGRHPFRYGVFSANVGHMKKEEITLAEALKTKGYTTGHFGKWHLGTLTIKIKDANRGDAHAEDHFSPPWANGFDVCFSTESKVPTWNPMFKEGTKEPYGTRYWTGQDKFVPIDDPSLQGDDSRVIMDRAIPFIKKAAAEKSPFLAVIWFHTPHLPVIAGEKYKAMYPDCTDNQKHYYGCITAMDEQIGRLRGELKNLGIENNTMLWFSSDNGPEGSSKLKGRTQGQTKGLRGRKRSLFEGGVRVPGLLVWPEKIKQPKTIDIPCSTLDYFPTVLDILGFKMPDQPLPIDGVSLKPLIEGKMTARPRAIGFQHGSTATLTDNRYKLISQKKGKTFMLFDLVEDPHEKNDIIEQNPQIAEQMKQQLQNWIASCEDSNKGNDYKE